MSHADDIEDSSAPLIEHLAELRTRLIRSVLAFVVAMIFCFSFGSAILDFLLVPIEQTMRDLGNPNPVMQYTAPQEYFFTLVRISMVGGWRCRSRSSPTSFGVSSHLGCTRMRNPPFCPF